MTEKSSEIAASLPPAVQRAAAALNWWGQVGLWVQVVLGIVAGVTLIFAAPDLVGTRESGFGSGVGVLFAIGGLIALSISAYFCFRYRQVSRRLRTADAATRPSRGDIIRLIRIGLTVNLLGMLLTLLGAFPITGVVLFKSLTQPQLVIGADPREFVNSIDLLIIQAIINAIAAHFAGLSSSLWLLYRITR